MDLQKINIKVFGVEEKTPALTTFIDVFHGWIQATDGVYHDVADYSHMQAGPGIVLVAQEANVAVDETGGKRGLLYSQKARLEGSNQDKLRHVIRAALGYCRRLEEDPLVTGKLKFRFHEIEMTINDRLIAPNTNETFLAIKGDLESVLHDLYGGAAVSLERDSDPRKRLSLRIEAGASFEIGTLLENLARESRYEAVFR